MIDHEIFSTVILSLLLIQEGQLSVSGERMCTILVNRLEDYACPVNVWLGKLTALDMTPLGWLGRKTSTQTNTWRQDQLCCMDFPLKVAPGFESFQILRQLLVYKCYLQNDYKISQVYQYTLTLVLLNPDMSCHCKQCRSRSIGFWRSQLIWICTVCH